jgi:hypothetical protein
MPSFSKLVRDNGNQTWNSSGRDVIARKLNCSTDEVLVSFAHLAEMDCIFFMDSTGPYPALHEVFRNSADECRGLLEPGVL